MANKVINKVIIIGMVYMVLFTIYMIYAPSVVVGASFWRSYYYLLMYAFPFALFITFYSLADTVLQKLFILVMIIFLFELICYNIALIHKDVFEWTKACLSKTFGFIFAGSIVVLLGTTLIINKRT